MKSNYLQILKAYASKKIQSMKKIMLLVLVFFPVIM